MKYEFTIPIPPVAWERVKRGRNGHCYVPPKTAAFKSAVNLYGQSVAKGRLLVGPLKLTAHFILTRPKTIKRLLPWTRPDLDNYIKALKDGLNGAVYQDDAQIVQYGLGTGKYYGPQGMKGYIHVLLEELEPIDHSGISQ